MKASEFPLALINWRRANGLRQSDMANLLGISQGTISRWEAGSDVPSASRLRDIAALLQHARASEPFALDKAFVSLQNDVRALFDHREARLLAVSEGLRKLWPSFATLIGVEMRQHLTGESRLLYEDPSLAAKIRMREIGIVVGISERHVSLSPDAPMKHRWILAFRHDGGQTAGEIVYQRCDPSLPLGIEQIIAVDGISARHAAGSGFHARGSARKPR